MVKLATDPAVRAQLGAAALKDIDNKLAVVHRALEYGGFGNAQAAGEVIGSVAFTVIGAVDVAYGAAKGAATLASIGVKLTKGVVKGAETAKGVAKTAPHVAPEAKPTPPTVNSTTASVKGDTPDVTPDGQPVKIIVAEDRFPESAQHIKDAQQAGQPNILTIDRAGASANRRAALKGKPTEPGKDRDEFPPAFTKEGGEGASVRNIGSSDNRGSGACVGQQCQGLPNGTKIEIFVVPTTPPKPPTPPKKP